MPQGSRINRIYPVSGTGNRDTKTEYSYIAVRVTYRQSVLPVITRIPVTAVSGFDPSQPLTPFRTVVSFWNTNYLNLKVNLCQKGWESTVLYARYQVLVTRKRMHTPYIYHEFQADFSPRQRQPSSDSSQIGTISYRLSNAGRHFSCCVARPPSLSWRNSGRKFVPRPLPLTRVTFRLRCLSHVAVFYLEPPYT